MEDEMQVSDIEIDELAVAGGSIDRLPDEPMQRRVEGLQRRNRSDGRRGDGMPHRALAEEPHERLDLGELWHAAMLSPSADFVTRASGRRVENSQPQTAGSTYAVLCRLVRARGVDEDVGALSTP